MPEILLAPVIGVLYGTGVYLILRRSIVKVVFGMMLLGHAANLLIFVAARLTRGEPAFIPHDPEAAATVIATAADPLPQALILTAIVIGFGIQAFALILIKQLWLHLGTDDVDNMRSTEQ